MLAKFNGVQNFPGRKPFELWTTEMDQLGRPRFDTFPFVWPLVLAGSTVSAETLRKLALVPVNTFLA